MGAACRQPMSNPSQAQGAAPPLEDLPPITPIEDMLCRPPREAASLQQKKFTKTHLVVHNIKQKEGESTRAFVTRYTDDTLQILGLHEEQCIYGFVHGLQTRSLVEFLSADLLTSYKGLMEKNYTWIEAKEVATNGTPNDRQ
ncbi:hypothetical protein Tco_0869546 [Tanacetum coccineum]